MIRRVRLLLIILIIVTAGAVIFEITRPYRYDNPIDSLVDEMIGRSRAGEDAGDEEFPVYIELPSDADLNGQIQVSEERLEYVNDEMTLIVPSIGFSGAVQAGTSRAALKNGPGLFESSGIPGQPGANVSIAGHRTRDTFYYLDRVGEEDRVYIIYNSYIYTYVYYDRNIVLPSDWHVISGQGFDACTLITCTPVRVADKRLVVRFILESITEESAADAISTAVSNTRT